MSDEEARAEMRRREAEGLPAFQHGDEVAITKEHAYGLGEVPATVCSAAGLCCRVNIRFRSAGQADPTHVHYDDEAEVREADRVCMHPEHWILVRPVRS